MEERLENGGKIRACQGKRINQLSERHYNGSMGIEKKMEEKKNRRTKSSWKTAGGELRGLDLSISGQKTTVTPRYNGSDSKQTLKTDIRQCDPFM